MGTDYDSWLLNIVEGNGDEICEECEEDLDDCACEDDYDHDYDPDFDEKGHIMKEEARYEKWLDDIKDKGGK